ncbi:cobyric acid synthase [bacterium]|nr:MAG: cobyric acid synthase [bacterium]
MKKHKAKPVMLQGTSSHVGKSVLTAAICRILKNRGLEVAPFKAQNMSLNSFVAKEGGEIGVAQAFQAEAAQVEPSIHFNPILLKPSGDLVSQVIIHGRVFGAMNAREYHAFKKEAKKFVAESYKRLEKEYDVIVIEGAGSPAEINLRKNDLANMGMADIADSPVLLIGDIDRGGVFASLFGTMELLTKKERARVAGFIINKFRGDVTLLKSATAYLTKRTGVSTLGIVPYISTAALPDEDSVSLERVYSKARSNRATDVNVKVIRLPRISNFTDFDPFKTEQGVSLDFIEKPEDLNGARLVIIPGSKNTIEDLIWLKEKGFDSAIRRFVKSGCMVAGICGGFQMLGKVVKDPSGVESRVKSAKGLGLLDAVTTLEKNKKTFQVDAYSAMYGGCKLGGYEIHMGITVCNAKPFARIIRRNKKAIDIDDGGVSKDGAIWGTYIHGIFDNDAFRQGLIKELRGANGADNGKTEPFRDVKNKAMENLAEVVRQSIDMERLLRIIGI